jgi:hypothetical protein
MSLESTTTIKAKLATGLGPKATRYYSTLQSFLAAKISRTEFDEQIREYLDTSQLGMVAPSFLRYILATRPNY